MGMIPSQPANFSCLSSFRSRSRDNFPGSMNLQKSRLNHILMQFAVLISDHRRLEVTREAGFNPKRRSVHVIEWFRAANERYVASDGP